MFANWVGFLNVTDWLSCIAKVCFAFLSLLLLEVVYRHGDFRNVVLSAIALVMT